MAGMPPMRTPTGASLTDILTTAQNVVTAINALAKAYTDVQGAINMPGIAVATLVKASGGRTCTIVVTTAGTTVGHLYDANMATATTNLLYVIPNTVGLTVVNIPATYGIVVAPGSGQVVTVTYS